MSMIYRRIGVFAILLGFAAGASAIAIEVTPSNSITLRTTVEGISGDPEETRVHIEATSLKVVKLESNTCKEKGMAGTLPASEKSGYRDIEEAGRPKERVYYYKLAIVSKTIEGTCALRFSDGGSAETVNVRIVKPL